MSPTPYVQRCVNLERSDFHAVAAFAEHLGLGRRGFSAALRIIIRDWAVHIAPLESAERPPADRLPFDGILLDDDD